MTRLNKIPMTEYRLPNRQVIEHIIHTPDEELYAKAMEIMNQGFVFTLERLNTGDMVQYITDDRHDTGDVGISITFKHELDILPSMDQGDWLVHKFKEMLMPFDAVRIRKEIEVNEAHMQEEMING
jgi:hypothetical protein